MEQRIKNKLNELLQAVHKYPTEPNRGYVTGFVGALLFIKAITNEETNEFFDKMDKKVKK